MMMTAAVAATATAATGPAAAGLGAGPGPADRPAPPRNLTAPAGFTPLFCAGNNVHEDDDSVEGDPGHQALWVDLSEDDCTSTTLPLLETWLGIPAGDLFCDVGIPHAPSPLFSLSTLPMSPHVSLPRAPLLTRRTLPH